MSLNQSIRAFIKRKSTNGRPQEEGLRRAEIDEAVQAMEEGLALMDNLQNFLSNKTTLSEAEGYRIIAETSKQVVESCANFFRLIDPQDQPGYLAMAERVLSKYQAKLERSYSIDDRDQVQVFQRIVGAMRSVLREGGSI